MVRQGEAFWELRVATVLLFLPPLPPPHSHVTTPRATMSALPVCTWLIDVSKKTSPTPPDFVVATCGVACEVFCKFVYMHARASPPASLRLSLKRGRNIPGSAHVTLAQAVLIHGTCEFRHPWHLVASLPLFYGTRVLLLSDVLTNGGAFRAWTRQ